MKQKARIKAKIVNDVINVKLQIRHDMLSKDEANKQGVKQDYIVQIIVKIKERLIFEFHPTERITKNPIIKLKCRKKEIQKGDKITVTWKTLLNETDNISGQVK